MANLIVWGLIDGSRRGIICIFTRSSFCDTNHQVPGASVFSTEAKDCQGAPEIPTDMGAGVRPTRRCKTVRLPCELAPKQRPSENSWRGELKEHETEYGTHWNFFFTMGTLPILEVLLHPILPFAPISMIAIAIALCWSCYLSQVPPC
jgi:hypothetical protein